MILFATATPHAPTFAEQLQSFVTGVLSLDPEQAAIRGGLSVLVFIGGALLMWGLRLVLKALAERFAPSADGGEKHKHGVSNRWAIRVARIAVLVAVILIILRVWGFDLDILMRGPIGAVLGVLWRVALIVVIASAAIELCSIGIRSLFTRVANRSKSIRRASQVRTLAPVLSGVATTAIVIAATMMALSEVGVEIGPLLAGAGIVGLAVGFGAQTIVKDFLTGIFLIVEDAVSVGDVVMISDFSGVVEEMSIRTIKLRDFDGTLHIFPYSEAQVIHNRTKNFGFSVFNLSVTYSSDVSRALEIMKQVGDELKAEESFTPFILSPIEVVGVDQLAEAGVLLKARMKTAPGKQWMIAREYLHRIKKAFDAEDIEIVSKQTAAVPLAPPAQ